MICWAVRCQCRYDTIRLGWTTWLAVYASLTSRISNSSRYSLLLDLDQCHHLYREFLFLSLATCIFTCACYCPSWCWSSILASGSFLNHVGNWTYVGNNKFCHNFGYTHYCFLTKCEKVACHQYVNCWIGSPLNWFTVHTHQVCCCRSSPNPLSRPVEVSIVSILQCPYLAQSIAITGLFVSFGEVIFSSPSSHCIELPYLHPIMLFAPLHPLYLYSQSFMLFWVAKTMISMTVVISLHFSGT